AAEPAQPDAFLSSTRPTNDQEEPDVQPAEHRDRLMTGGLPRVAGSCPCCHTRYKVPAASMPMSSCGPKNENPQADPNGQSGPWSPVATSANFVSEVPARVSDTR